MQGYTASLESSGLATYCADAPSILGMPYLAVHGARHVAVGSTKQDGLLPAEALQAAQANSGAGVATSSGADAAEQLKTDMAAVWAPLQEWSVAKVCSVC